MSEHEVRSTRLAALQSSFSSAAGARLGAAVACARGSAAVDHCRPQTSIADLVSVRRC